MTAAPTLKLYEIAADIEAITEELVANGGEITDAIAAQLEAMEGAFAAKVERTALAIRNLEGTAKAASDEVERLSELASSRKKAAERLREYLAVCMEAANVPKVETPLVKARLQQARESIVWTKPVEELPAEYQRITIAANLRRAHDTLDLGETLPEGFEVREGKRSVVLK